MLFMRIIKFCSLLLFFAQSQVFANVNTYFNHIKTDPNALYAFLKKMPKGGELHYHLAGGAYPETMLSLAALGNYCLDKKNFIISKNNEACLGIKSADLAQDPLIYDKAIRAWSMKDFVPGKESGHDHFFASFYKFLAIVADHRPELLAEIMQRAASQNELYLEVMILPDNAHSSSFINQLITLNDLTKVKAQLLNNEAYKANISHTVNEASRILQQAREYLGCDKQPLQKVCHLTVKFQYYVLREQSLDKVFAQALNGFAAAAQSKDIVAVNLVQPEDGFITLRDYQKHMQIFNFLHQVYPQVHISLHAGELSPEAVTPENLRFHMTEAVKTGHAERVGHGVSVAYENDAEHLLETLAQNNIAVEINLISNKKILNISGKEHPLPFYLAHNVPITLSTDDEGILRTDLTQQYVEAVINYNLDYPTLKMFSRNALTYSFLPGKSIWDDAKKALPIPACRNLNSSNCLEFIKNNEKAKLQKRLEEQFSLFEKNYNNSKNSTVNSSSS